MLGVRGARGVAPAAGASQFSQGASEACLDSGSERWIRTAVVVCLLLAVAPALKADSSHRAKTSRSRTDSAVTVDDSAEGVAPAITIVEFSDFQCPYCSGMVPVIDQLLKAYPGKVHVIVKDFPLSIHSDAELAHEAVQAAKAQGKYWEMYHLVFANQRHLKRGDLIAYAQQLGLDIVKFQGALDTRRYKGAVRESEAEGEALGVKATPTFFVNGEKLDGAQTFEFLKSRVEVALNGGQARVVTASAESKKTDIPVANSPVRGSPNAPVTIVEYADFQCPFCAKSKNTVDQILQEYPDKVKVVFKSFPLDFHENAMLAHKAALSAGRQGKFWEMHDLIFAHQQAIKHDDLFAMAKTLGLDMGKFASDLDSDAVKAEIEAERAQGRVEGVDGTPTFYVDGTEMVGAIGVMQFEAAIDRSLRARGIETAKAPVMADGGPTKGPEHAPVTVLWYSDVTSPLAAGASKLVDQVLEAYPGEVRVVFKNRPLEFHKDAELAHEALMAAAAQGKFWAMHKLLVAHPNAVSSADLLSYAGQAGLDTQKFFDALTARTYRDQVQRDVSQAREADVNGVPVFFVNGKRVDGVQTLSSFKAILDQQVQSSRVAAVRE